MPTELLFLRDAQPTEFDPVVHAVDDDRAAPDGQVRPVMVLITGSKGRGDTRVRIGVVDA